MNEDLENKETENEEVESEPPKKLVIGYGTFIIKAANGDERLNSIVGVCEVKDFNRIYHPKFSDTLGYWYPFAVKDKKSSFKALVYEVSEKDIESLDFYEGVPNLYERVTCKIRLNGSKEKQEAEIYVPSEYTSERLEEELKFFFTEEEKKAIFKKDFWMEYLEKHHRYLQEIYPDLFE